MLFRYQGLWLCYGEQGLMQGVLEIYKQNCDGDVSLTLAILKKE